MSLRLVTPPSDYPVSLAEAKAHLNVTDDYWNSSLEIYRKAATEDAENFTGLAIMEQTWDYFLDEFPVGVITLPKPPLIEVVGVFSVDSAQAEQQFSSASYRVDFAGDKPSRISYGYAGSWPTPIEVINAVRVRFRSGFVVDPEASPLVTNVPFAIRAAILLTIGTLFAHKETVVVGQTATMMPWAAEQLLRPYRVYTAIS